MRKLFTLLILSSCLASCNKLLEERQTTSLVDGLYDTEEVLESHIYGILGRFYGSTMYTGEGVEFLNLCTPLIHHGLESTVVRNAYYSSALDYTQYSTSAKSQNFFRGMFNIVNACNVLMAHLPDSPVEEAYKREIEAEARFYRAFAYFRLVRTWGDVPIRRECISSANVNALRDPWYRVYEFIIEDLTFAQQSMRTPQRVEQLTPGKSRVSRYAATAVLSTVYCTIGSLLTSPEDNFWDSAKPGRAPEFQSIKTAEDAYRLALAEAEKLIPGTETYDVQCPYQLAANYGDLFRWDSISFPEVYQLKERVFVLPITNVLGNREVTLPGYTLPPYAEGTSYRDDLVSTSKGRWRPDRWAFQHWCEDYPGVKGTGSASNVWASSADPRLDYTLYHTNVYDQKNKSYSAVYPNPAKINANASSKLTYPYFRKYWSHLYASDAGEADLYLMRYAEVYLNAAEAAAETGDADKAYRYIEVLHARARASVPEGQAPSALPKWEPGKYATREQLRNQIFWERIYETFGENHEFDETHRHGATWLCQQLSEPMNAFLKLPEQAKLYNTEKHKSYFYPGPEPYEYVTDPQTARKGLLWDYPATELNYNDALTQKDQNDFTYGL